MTRPHALYLIPILALVFGACSPAASPSAVPGPTGSPAPTAVADPVTVKVWALPWTGDDMTTIWEPLIARFEAENPDINLEVEIIPAADRREKMLTAYAAGQNPDVVYVNLDLVDSFGRRGLFLPLDAALTPDIIADYPPDVLKAATYDNKTVMLPLLGAPWGAIYNKDLMAEVGWNPDEPPATWDEMRDFCDIAKSKGKYGWGISPNGLDFMILTWQAGGQTLTADGMASAVNGDAGRAALSYILDLNSSGCFPPDSATFTDANDPFSGSGEYFANDQQVISYMNDSSFIGGWKEQRPELKLGAFMGMAGKKFVTYSGAGAFATFANTKNPDAAIRVNLWLTDTQGGGLEYVTKSGFPPIRKSALEAYTKNVDEVTAGFAAAAQTTDVSHDTLLFFIEQYTIYKEELQAAMLGAKTVDQTLADMERRVNEAIAAAPPS